MSQYYHAHKIIAAKCNGRMKCMRYCPTQAIRVRDNNATISEELCVDCGMCLSVCPSEAIVPITDPISKFSRYKHKVIVPAPVFYSQFDYSIHPYIIHLALKKVGFDDVIDVTQIEDPGIQVVKWDGRTGRGSRTASGIFFICLQYLTYRKIRKVIFLNGE